MLATWLCVFQMEQKQVLPPFKPNISGEFGLDNFDAQFTNEPIQLTPDDEYVLFRRHPTRIVYQRCCEESPF